VEVKWVFLRLKANHDVEFASAIGTRRKVSWFVRFLPCPKRLNGPDTLPGKDLLLRTSVVSLLLVHGAIYKKLLVSRAQNSG